MDSGWQSTGINRGGGKRRRRKSGDGREAQAIICWHVVDIKIMTVGLGIGDMNVDEDVDVAVDVAVDCGTTSVAFLVAA